MKEFIENYNLQNLKISELYDFICNNDFSKEELKELLLSFIFYFENDEKIKDVLNDTLERI